MLKAKKWTILFVGLIVLCLLFIMGANYFIDPFGYFRAQSGECYTLNERYYLREIKAQYLKKHGKEYDAFLIGGSKAGALRTEKLQELDGYKYYNAWQLSGNFQDYYYYTKYVIENCNPKKILLHISTSEIKRFDREGVGDIYEIPAEIKGEAKIPEVFDFLFKNLSACVDEIKIQNNPKDHIYPCYPTGERCLTKYYHVYNGRKPEYYDFLFKEQVDVYLPALEKGPKDKSENVKLSIDMFRQMKELCDEHDVEFQVMVGTVFLGELVYYEGPSYYDFLEQMVQITGGLWSFNTYNDIMKNPFNYYNAYHYLYETGDLMIDNMTGKEKTPNFGVYLTMDNITEHIKQRKQEFAAIREQYLQTKQLPYLPYEDASNYKASEKDNYTDMKDIQ